MTCAEAVRLYLLTVTPLTALVNTRIWTFRFPQSPTKPGVCVFQISDPRDAHLRGTDGLRFDRVQIDVIADSIAAARSVDQAVMGAYVNGAATGLMGAQAVVGSPAVEIIQPGSSDNYHEEYDADELKQARVRRDYRVWFRE